VTEAGTRAEREAALALLDHAAQGKRRTLGADKQYQERNFVEALRQRAIVPHIAEYERGNLRRNSLREEERHGVGFLQSQRKRKLVEQSFAWIKHWAGFHQVKLRSGKRVEWLFQIAAAAYNLVRMTRLLAPGSLKPGSRGSSESKNRQERHRVGVLEKTKKQACRDCGVKLLSFSALCKAVTDSERLSRP